MFLGGTKNCGCCVGRVEEGLTPTGVGVQRVLVVPITIEQDILKVVTQQDVLTGNTLCHSVTPPVPKIHCLRDEELTVVLERAD